MHANTRMHACTDMHAQTRTRTRSYMLAHTHTHTHVRAQAHKFCYTSTCMHHAQSPTQSCTQTQAQVSRTQSMHLRTLMQHVRTPYSCKCFRVFVTSRIFNTSCVSLLSIAGYCAYVLLHEQAFLHLHSCHHNAHAAGCIAPAKIITLLPQCPYR